MIKTHHSNTIEVPITCSISKYVEEDASKRAYQFKKERIRKVIII